MADDSPVCMAGRSVFFGGRWKQPCEEPLFGRIHVIAAPGSQEILLCDKHFMQVQGAGLVDEPYVDREEWQRRRRGT